MNRCFSLRQECHVSQTNAHKPVNSDDETGLTALDVYEAPGVLPTFRKNGLMPFDQPSDTTPANERMRDSTFMIRAKGSGPETTYHPNGQPATTKIIDGEREQLLKFDMHNRLIEREETTPNLKTREVFSPQGRRDLLERTHFQNGSEVRKEEIRPDGYRISMTNPDGSFESDSEDNRYFEKIYNAHGTGRLFRLDKQDNSVYMHISRPDGTLSSFRSDRNSVSQRDDFLQTGAFRMLEIDKTTGLKWLYKRLPIPGVPATKEPVPWLTKGA